MATLSRHAAKTDTVLLGTSGWTYPDWKGVYYAEDLPSREYLRDYARHFRTAEFNRSFYHVPREKTLLQMRAQVPSDFIFAIKANRQITHDHQLQLPREAVNAFIHRVATLEDQLGPILFQLPPKLGFNLNLLSAFTAQLPTAFRYTLEFRNASWFREETYAVLADHNIAFCQYDLGGKLSPRQVTTDFVYIRLHGQEVPYRGAYTEDVLEHWASDIRTWEKQGKQVFCYFDNSIGGHAPLDAARLAQLLATP